MYENAHIHVPIHINAYTYTHYISQISHSVDTGKDTHIHIVDMKTFANMYITIYEPMHIHAYAYNYYLSHSSHYIVRVTYYISHITYYILQKHIPCYILRVTFTYILHIMCYRVHITCCILHITYYISRAT